MINMNKNELPVCNAYHVDEHGVMTKLCESEKFPCANLVALNEENQRLREALESACEAGLKLAEQCKLNPTAYVNDILRAKQTIGKKGDDAN